MSLVEIPDPPGYKVVGFRLPKNGESFIGTSGEVLMAPVDFSSPPKLIVEPVVVWRNATVADLERAPIKCRAKNEEYGPWIDKVLLGYRSSSRPYVWVTDDMSIHTTVQVVDETSPAK